MTGPARKQPGQELLALITARGGSKGLPRKNVLPLAGQPLIAWSIQAAQAAACRPRVVVSTDDEEIANAALAHGAEVPFLRPAHLAQDDSPHIDVILHAVHWLEHQRGYRPTWVLLLQPTSPLRLAQDIDQFLALARAQEANSVVSVREAPCHPYLAQTIDGRGRLRPFLPPPRATCAARTCRRPTPSMAPSTWSAARCSWTSRPSGTRTPWPW